MIIVPRDAWVLRRLLIGEAVNGERHAVSPPLRRLADHMNNLCLEDRKGAWEAFRCGIDDPDALVQAMAAVDPLGPPPETTVAAAAVRCATVADLTRIETEARFAWKSWIIRGHLTLLSSDVKVGKTRVGVSLARRIWYGEPWPDGQPASFPQGTRTLWIPGDRHHSELADLTQEFGLPPESLLLNADPESPYGGWDLDDPANVEGLRRRIETYRPGLVFIDTVWKTTRVNLCSMKDVNTMIDPIVTIAQETDTAILGMMHLSSGGETLGRRLEGIARAIIKMERPDPEGQPDRRRLWVDRANFKGAAPLGVTIKDGPCEFDQEPPEAASSASPRHARRSERQAECEKWLAERLEGNPVRVSVIRKEAEAEPHKFAIKTLYAAKDALGIDQFELDGKQWWRSFLESAPGP